jgi:ABC-type Fe3+-hydroxamate transport system substrate-binding protein
MVRSIAAALDAREAGEHIAADIEGRLARVRARVGDAPPVRWAYLIWRRPWMTVNGDTFVSAMLTAAGGENVFADRTLRYPTVEPTELAAADPALVLLASEPFPFAEPHADELAAATGLPRERFRLVDGELLSWHGSRTACGIDYAAELLHGVSQC